MYKLLFWGLDAWNILNTLMSIVALIGTVWNAQRDKYGFLFWIISNLYMVIRFAYIKEYPQMVLFFIYFILAVYGFINWIKKEQKVQD